MDHLSCGILCSRKFKRESECSIVLTFESSVFQAPSPRVTIQDLGAPHFQAFNQALLRGGYTKPDFRDTQLSGHLFLLPRILQRKPPLFNWAMESGISPAELPDIHFVCVCADICQGPMQQQKVFIKEKAPWHQLLCMKWCVCVCARGVFP